MKEKIELPTGVELSPRQLIVNALFQQDIVINEFYDTCYKAISSRTSNRDKILSVMGVVMFFV